jgi:hypothetical protein
VRPHRPPASLRPLPRLPLAAVRVGCDGDLPALRRLVGCSRCLHGAPASPTQPRAQCRLECSLASSRPA